MKEDKFYDAGQLMLAQADAGLVLVDPLSGRIEALNPAWPDWLGRSTAFLQGAVFGRRGPGGNPKWSAHWFH